jgi:acyl-CoA reductase-like NAD-dependent aldehyde dehydrogenase
MDAVADERIKSAHSAYESASRASPATRASWLEAIATGLESRSEELVGLAHGETRLAVPRLEGELRRTVFQLRLFAREVELGTDLDATIDHADPDWGMGPRPDLRRVNVPLGVVGVFGASNFPFAFSVAGGDTASALATGCAVVHKVHTAHEKLGEATAEIVIAALSDARAPEGLFSVIYGREAAISLVEHPLTAAVGFTGSTSVGRALFDRAAARPRPIPFFGELGSINPVIVTPGAWASRRRELIEGFAGSFTLGAGQFCTKPGLLFVPRGEDELAGILAAALAEFSVDGMLSPAIHRGFDAALEANRDEVGVTTLVEVDSSGVRATVLEIDADEVERHPAVLAREMFGPASLVIRYSHLTQVTRLIAQIEGQLTATLHAEATDDVEQLLEVLASKAGRVLWNGWPTGVTVSYAQQHGGPYPATTMPSSTSVGTSAMARFSRPVAFQAFPDAQLPEALQDRNPWGIRRRVDGVYQPEATSAQ